VVTPLAAHNVVPQPAQVVQENQDVGAKGKDNDGQGPQKKKKKKEEKQGAFDANNLDIILMTVQLLSVIYVSLYIMLPMLVIFIKLPSPLLFYMVMPMRHLCFLNLLVVLLRPKWITQS
jgi:hypothetical protein